MNGYNSTIDDEFASLFLQELQNTRSESARNNTLHNNNNDDDGSDLVDTNEAKKNDVQSDIDYINSREVTLNPSNLKPVSCAASYARYLPSEATIFSNYFDLNRLEETSGKHTGNTESEETKLIDEKSNDFKHISEFGSAISENTIDKSKKNESIEKPLIKGANKPSERDNAETLQAIANNVLLLRETSKKDTYRKPLSDSYFNGFISGRLFIDMESFTRLSKERNTLNVQQHEFDSHIICYRRNSIKLCFTINVKQLLSDRNFQNFDSISLNLYSVLRKKEKKETGLFSDIQREELKFRGIDNDTDELSNLVQMNKSNVSIKHDALVNVFKAGCNKVVMNWEQVQFNSASGSNRYDTSTKYHFIILEVKIHKSDAKLDEIIDKSVFESCPIMVRGRNPMFYSAKGDILIGKIKKIDESNETPDKIEGKVIKSRRTPEAMKRKNTTDENKTSTEENTRDNSTTIEENSDSLGSLNSGYQYFKVDENYYLPPVEVGYFPHHVHHNKQVFKPTVIPLGIADGHKMRKQYNYFL